MHGLRQVIAGRTWAILGIASLNRHKEIKDGSRRLRDHWNVRDSRRTPQLLEASTGATNVSTGSRPLALK